MKLSDMKKIGSRKLFLKYKFDLLTLRKMESEEKITHNASMIGIGAGLFLVGIAWIFSVVVEHI